MVESMIVGYVRKSINGNAIKVSISVDAFEKAKRITNLQGQEFVSLVISVRHLKALLDGEKDVTSVCQIG